MPSLLIVGGLTIDRFPDGSLAPGGSVLHAGLAAVAEGSRPTVVTVAGDEPTALEGLTRLEGFGALRRQRSSATTTYRHEEVDGRRVLFYEAAAEPIRAPAPGGGPRADVALFAPIADELAADVVDAFRRSTAATTTVLLIQGWLRRLRIGEPVVPLSLDELSDAVWATFGAADAIVVSTEDLATDDADPFLQAAALRHRLGPGPILLLTLGAEGYLLDDPAADRVVASVPRRVVFGVPAVGAGDTFGAALALHLAAADDPARAAEAATERVIAVLEARRRS